MKFRMAWTTPGAIAEQEEADRKANALSVPTVSAVVETAPDFNAQAGRNAPEGHEIDLQRPPISYISLQEMAKSLL